MAKKTVGEKISDLRKERKIQQDEFADRIGVSRQALSQWETGKQIPRADKIAEICEKFGVDGNYFYSDDELAELEESEAPMPEMEPKAEENSEEKGEEDAPPAVETAEIRDRRKKKITLRLFSKIFGIVVVGAFAFVLLFAALAVFIVAISPNVNETTVRVWAIDTLALAILLFFLACVAIAWVVLRLIVFIEEERKHEKE